MKYSHDGLIHSYCTILTFKLLVLFNNEIVKMDFFFLFFFLRRLEEIWGDLRRRGNSDMDSFVKSWQRSFKDLGLFNERNISLICYVTPIKLET